MKKILSGLLSFIMTLTLVGCSVSDKKVEELNKEEKISDKNTEVRIVRHPSSWEGIDKIANLKDFPKYDSGDSNSFQVDLRNSDLKKFDLSNELDSLIFADFNTRTLWPESLPKEYDYNKIMELGKNPGLGIKKIHENGITGRGIGIGIIDQTLLVDHEEFKDKIKLYEEMGEVDNTATMHGSAVASIAVGKSCGVAPGANLYYIAANPGNYTNGRFTYDFSKTAAAIERLLEVNKGLDKENKIRVISISVGWNEDQLGYDKISEAIDHAKKEGILVVSSSLSKTYGYKFNGLGRNPYEDPNELNSYKLCEWQSKDAESLKELPIDDMLFVPMDSRTTASENSIDDYAFYRVGGWSWSIPYIAGIYALCCEVDPEITYDEFWRLAIETAEAVTISSDEGKYTIPKVINPRALIEKISN